ncbi:MAG: DUF2252 domain-containing protein [Candidatus Korobacteraceae bacterium]
MPSALSAMAVIDPAHRTREERRTFGRSLRTRVKRVDQGVWSPKQRTFDVVDLLHEANRTRIAHLMPIKYARMAASPFGFFRGAVPVMAADLATRPYTGLMTHICGDAHVQNLGAFEAPDGRLIFDINDFDESVIGPWEWDIKRMAASLILAGREAGNSDKLCKAAVLAFVERYREFMRMFSEMAMVDLARFQIYRVVSPVKSVLRKAERATPEHNLRKLTIFANGKHRFRDEKPCQFHVRHAEAGTVIESLGAYVKTLLAERAHFFVQYQPEDVAFRVVGTGSVGTRDYIVLMFAGAIADPLFIQVKEEPPSAYAAYVAPDTMAAHQGQRVIEGQRAMQMQSDLFLGWTSIEGRDYIVRQLRDHKAAIEDEDLKGNGLVQYAHMVGELLAKGHARSGDPCALAGYLGMSDRFDDAMVSFGITYANQTVKDWEALRHAIRIGRVKAAAELETSKQEPAKKKSSKKKSAARE